MFGTRADLVIDLTFLVTLLAPVIAFVSTRYARRRAIGVHARLQTALLVVGWSAVLALEGRIRLGGGSGSLVSMAAPEWASTARALLLVHIGGAVVTYVAWTALVVLSRRRRDVTLPGPFSRLHRRLGWTVLAGLAFTAVSATGMYVMSFVV